MRTIRYALLGLALLAAPVQAQDRPPQGIGFAQAEEGTWLCRHEEPEEALSCARELCAEQAAGQECYSTAWCYPANWSGLMVIWLGDFHTTHAFCGAPNEGALNAALRELCAGNEGATSCDIVKTIDPEGNEYDVVGVSFPGPVPVADPAAATQPPAVNPGEGVTDPQAPPPDLQAPPAGP